MLALYISFVVALIALFGAIFGIFKYVSARVSGVYTNFDKFKTEIKDDYVQKDMCKMIDGHRNEDIKRLEVKLDEIIKLLMQERQMGNDNG